MASIIFNAIGKGYSARSILGAIGRNAPQYANIINTAYYAGYTAESILSRLASKMDGKHYNEDRFLTAREKTLRNDDRNKTRAYTQTIAALGLAGTVAAGAYALMQRNRPPRPELIIPGSYGKKANGKGGHTILHQNKALPNRQKQIPYNQKQLESKGQKLLPAPMQPKQQPQSMVPPIPSPNQPQQPPAASSGSQQPESQYNPKNVDVVRNLREEQRFKNIIEAGYDPIVSTQILRQIVPKDVLSVMEKADGGLEQIVKDYSGYMKDIQKQQTKQQETQQTQQALNPKQLQEPLQPPQEAAEQVGQIQLPRQGQQQQPPPSAQVQPQQQAPAEMQPEPQQINAVEQPKIQKPQAPVKPLVSLKNGKIGEVESVKNGVTTVNIDGKTHKEKSSNITEEPPEIESAVRQVINSVPEDMKSTALQSMVHIPGLNILLTQFYDGKWAWYTDVQEELYKNIAMGTYQPKGQAVTGIAEYKPGVADSRGAGFHNEIKINPKYSKENKGITWGYASNEYALLSFVQKFIHKISKERYDEFGKLIVSKVRHKKPSE